MKVIFLAHQNPQGYRIQHYFPFFRRHGMEVNLMVVPRKWGERCQLFRTLPEYDLVYVQRRLMAPADLFFLRRGSKRLVYDFDDAVMYRSSRHTNPSSFSRRWAFRSMVKASDAVIAGNRFLEEEALKYTTRDRVWVVPTVVDPGKYPPKAHEKPGGPVILGWIGSASTLWYLQNLVPVWRALSRQYAQLRLKIVSDAFFDCPQVPIIKKRWNAEEEVFDLQSFDIGLLPLTDDVWSRGKCGLKAVQYSAVGVPVVCSPVGMNRDIIEDGLNGYWASTDAEWIARISKLIEEPQLRVEMGMHGRERVVRRFSLDWASERVFRLFSALCSEPGECGAAFR